MGSHAWMRQLRQRAAQFRSSPTWGRRARWLLPLAASFVSGIFLLCFFLPAGCSFNSRAPLQSAGAPIVRVRLMQAVDTVYLTATTPPGYRTTADPTLRTLNLPSKTPVTLMLVDGVWKVGGTSLGGGVLTLLPNGEGTLSVANAASAATANHANDGAYRGQYRFAAVTPAPKFDVINDLDLDSYLAGVLPKELPRGWHDEAYKAQAIVARTYALYHKAKSPAGREYDLNPDTRSQVYGGLSAETDKSLHAVADTAGIVVACGAPGQERIFEAYFNSCCGGVTQSAADAFGMAPQAVLVAHSNGATCNASPNFTWGPVVIRKDELTRRLRQWGSQKPGRPEKGMAPVKTVSVEKSNEWGRTTHFLIEDAAGNKYRLVGEEFRWAVNCDADHDPAHPPTPTTLKSSFVKVISDSDTIRFVEGHGFGHGVGMCQWCAERRAEDGMAADEIVLAAFPGARLSRAY